MPRYLGTTGYDTNGRAGPTLQSIGDKHNYAQARGEVASTLASVFAPLGVSLAAYSPDAQAILKPATLSSEEIKTMRDIFRGSGNLQDVFKKLSLARIHPISNNIDDLGKGWERFESTPITSFGEGKLKEALRMASGYRMNISHPANKMVDNFPEGANLEIGAGVRAGKDLLTDKSGVGAFYTGPSGNTPGKAMLNAENLAPFNDQKRSIYHELQHHYDRMLGRSSGSSPTSITDEQLAKFNKDLPSNAQATKNDVYYHNTGEVRGRLNAMLESNPEQYGNLKSAFNNPYDNIQRTYLEKLWD